MSSIKQRLLYLFILFFIQLVGIGLFSKGFFPYKVHLSGFAAKEDVPSSFLTEDLHRNHWQEPKFDRLVFVVIDALRKLVKYESKNVTRLILKLNCFIVILF